MEHGMDPITYLPDPADPKKKMVSILYDHSLFTLESTQEAEKDQLARYDSHDHLNSQDAALFLRRSLDEDLETQLSENCSSEETFCMMWFHLCQILGSVSVDKFERIKDRIKDRKLAQYPGENLDAMCSDYLADFRVLHGARVFEWSLIMCMVREMMSGGNENFRFEMRDIKRDLDKTLLEIRNMSYLEASRKLTEKKVDVREILKKVKALYHKEFDDGLWPAAMKSKDTRALSKEGKRKERSLT